MSMPKLSLKPGPSTFDAGVIGVAVSVALFLVSAAPAFAQLACDVPEPFDQGVPAGWSTAGSPAWGDAAACGEGGNYTGGDGGVICVSGAGATPGPILAELRAPAADLTAVSSAALRFRLNYQSFADSDSLAVEASIDGGVSWRPLLERRRDAGLFRTAPGEVVELDLDGYAGASDLRLRWRYADPDPASLGWYLQLDDVELACDPAPRCGAGVVAADRLVGGGFEPGTADAWTAASTAFGSPLCTTDGCATAAALEGVGWAAFGAADGAETASLEQSVVLRPPAAELEFSIWNPRHDAAAGDSLRLLVDGAEVWATDGASPLDAAGYRRIGLDLSAFADGAAHALRFESSTGSGAVPASFFVDRAHLLGCPETAAAPEISLAGAAVVEGDDGTVEALFTVRLSHPWSAPIAVDYATADGTATAGADYVATSGTATIPAGETWTTIPVAVTGDLVAEGGESFSLRLTGADAGTLADAEAAGTVVDDDSRLSVADVTAVEGDGGGSVRVVVTLSHPAEAPVGATFATVAESATAGVDYQPRSGTVTFPAGSVRQVVSIPLLGDRTDELDETFRFELTAPAGAKVADGSAVVTIADDDTAELVVGDAGRAEGDEGSSLLAFPLRLQPPRDRPTAVTYATADAATGVLATAGVDYLPAQGTVTVPAGATSATVTVEVIGDRLEEEDELFALAVTPPAGVLFAGAGGEGGILDDDRLAFSVADAELSEAEAGAAAMVFAVTLSAAATEAVTVDYSTADLTAVAGEDYVAVAGTLTFDPGELTREVTVEVLDDAVDEPAESLRVELAAPSLGILARAAATGTVRDDDGVTADAGGPYAGAEGEPILLDASGSSHPTGTITGYEWDLDGDGVFDDGTFEDATGAVVPGTIVTGVFPDDGTYTVAVRVTDDSGEQDVDTAEVTVSNAAPTVDAGADASVGEGDAATLAVTFTDPGAGDVHTATVDWGDGTPVGPASVNEEGGTGTVAASHPYPDDGTFPVTVCVTDDDGATGCDAFTLTVVNADPVLTGGDPVDLGSWHAEDRPSSAPASNWSVSSDGTEATQWNNSRATVFLGDLLITGAAFDARIRVNTSQDDDAIGFVLGFEPGDFENPDAGYLLVDWRQRSSQFTGGGGVTYTAHRGLRLSRVTGKVSGTGLGAHVGDVQELAQANTLGDYGWRDYTWYHFTFDLQPDRIRIWVDGVLQFDEPGDFDFGGGRLGFYSNSQKRSQFRAVSQQRVTAFEGEEVPVTVRWSDAGILDDHTATADWGDGTVAGATLTDDPGDGAAGTVTASHRYRDDGLYSGEVCVTDDDGGTGCEPVAVTVLNRAPVVESASVRPAFPGEPFELDLPFTDPGAGDVHTATVDWGDGTTSTGTVSESDGAGVVTASHLYAVDELDSSYQVTVCVTDDDGDTGCGTTTAEFFPAEHDLAVHKQATASAARPGDPLFYALTVENRGTREPRGVVVQDHLPAELAFVAAGGGGVYDPASHTVTWQLPVVRLGETVYLDVETATPSSSAGGDLVNTATVTDDGRFGPDGTPGDNTATVTTPLAAEGTPVVDAGLRNLARDPRTVVRSSRYEVGRGPERLADGKVWTSWQVDCGYAANQGGSPWVEVALGEPSTVREVRLFGDRDFNPPRSVIAGVFTLYGTDGTLLHTTGEVTLEGEYRDYLLRFAGLHGVARLRFDVTADVSCSPGIGELELWGFAGDQDRRLEVSEGGWVAIPGRVQDTASEAHTLEVDWGDGTVDVQGLGTASESTFLTRHAYYQDGVYQATVCVRDAAELSSCETVEVAVMNAAPEPITPGTLDPGRWSAESYPAHDAGEEVPAWQASADPLGFLETAHTPPALLHGPFHLFGDATRVTVRLEPDVDDDYVGFAFGVEEGVTGDYAAEYYLLDWKGGDQYDAPRGMAVSRVYGVPGQQDFWHRYSRPESGVVEIGRAATLGNVGWQIGRDYEFTFAAEPDRLRVWVDGVLQFDLAGTFPNSRLGLFVSSQRNIRFHGFPAAAPVTITEGESASVSGVYQDAGAFDLHTATVEWGDGTPVEPLALTQGEGSGQLNGGPHRFLDDFGGGPGTRVCVTDDGGAEGCGIWPITVLNQPPAVTAGDGAELLTGELLDLAATFTDPGLLDVHTATVDWGDGTVEPAEVSSTAGADTSGNDVVAGTVTADHAYATEGVYTAEVCVTDDDGGTGCDAFEVTVLAELPPPPGCHTDSFDQLGSEWRLAHLGDADQGAAEAVDGRLHLTGDGVSLYRGADDGAFLHQLLGGDLRLEVDVTAILGNTGGEFRKVCLMLRAGLGELAPRVMACFVADHPDPYPTALQFDVRTAEGDAGEELAHTVFDVPLPVRLALERQGDQVTASYSTDGGATWTVPTGALGGSAEVPMAGTVAGGVIVASYDAQETMTAELDRFSVCPGAAALPSAEVGDVVWDDRDGDGVQGLDEPGLEGVALVLADGAGYLLDAHLLDATVTDADGHYRFERLPGGDYGVAVDPATLPAGVDVPTHDADGASTPDTVLLTVAGAESNLTVDFGYQERDFGPPSTVCDEDPFDQAPLADGWLTTHLGDATTGDAQVAEEAGGGTLHLSGDGSSLYHGADNGYFAYREVSGDFRVEVDVESFPTDAGGDFRKACLMVRASTDPQAARVMSCFVPHFPDPPSGPAPATAVQFDLRAQDGALPVELAGTLFHPPLPIRLAIERRGEDVTVYTSLDGGATWTRPVGDFGGTAELPLPDTVLAGVAVASYETGTAFTAELDDQALCRPNAAPPVDPPSRVCDPSKPLDVVYLLDASSSMTVDFADPLGAPSTRYDQAREALLTLHGQLTARGDGSRAALVTWSGHDTRLENFQQTTRVLSGLTGDLAAVEQLLAGLDPAAVDPDGRTATAIAVGDLRALLADELDPTHRPVVVLLTDGVPNVDVHGRGPVPYDLEEVQAITLYDDAGAFRPWGEVAWLGGFNPEIGTFDGEVLADVMAQLETLRAEQPEVEVYGVTLEGSGTGYGSYNGDLVDYAAFVTGGGAYTAADGGGLQVAVGAVGDELACVE